MKSKLPYLQDIIIFLLESEVTGFKYENEINVEKFLETINKASILIDDQKDSVKTGVLLYRSGKLLDSLKVIFPILESMLDNSLKKINLNPSELHGLKGKVKRLEEKRLISYKLSIGLEICSTIRNKVVHGNILEEDIDIIEPLYALTLRHIEKLIKELDKNLKKIKVD